MSYTYKEFTVTVPDGFETTLSTFPTLFVNKVYENFPQFNSYEVQSSDTSYYIYLKHATSKITLRIGLYKNKSSSTYYFLISFNGTAQANVSMYGITINIGSIVYFKMLVSDKTAFADYSVDSGYNRAISAMEVEELATGYLWVLTSNPTSPLTQNEISIPSPKAYMYTNASGTITNASCTLFGDTRVFKGCISRADDSSNKCILITPLLYNDSAGFPLGVCRPSDDCMKFITANSGAVSISGGYTPVTIGNHVYLGTTATGLFAQID